MGAATKQPTYPKVAVFNLGRAHVWWRERREKERSTSLSGARFKWTDWFGEGKTGDRCGTRARQATHLWRPRRCGNSTNRKASTRIACESLSTSTISTLLDPQEFPPPLLSSRALLFFCSPKNLQSIKNLDDLWLSCDPPKNWNSGRHQDGT